MDLTEILTVVVCGCCGVLCIVVLYLCILVRRIRRDLNELLRNGNLVYSDPNANRREEKGKEEYKRKRESSSATRYTIEPGKGSRQSAVHLAPDETVTVLNRPGEEAPVTLSTFQVAGSSKEEIPLQFVNESFVPDGSRDHSSSSSSSEDRSHPQPIYSNEVDGDEQPIYENNNPIDEPVYLNRGELATFHNPERPRLHTMDITDIA